MCQDPRHRLGENFRIFPETLQIRADAPCLFPHEQGKTLLRRLIRDVLRKGSGGFSHLPAVFHGAPFHIIHAEEGNGFKKDEAQKPRQKNQPKQPPLYAHPHHPPSSDRPDPVASFHEKIPVLRNRRGAFRFRPGNSVKSSQCRMLIHTYIRFPL